MKGARIGRRRDKVHRPRMARVADIGDRKAVRKHVPDKGMALMDHDLHPIAPPLLVGVADKLDVARGNRGHPAGPSLKHLAIVPPIAPSLSTHETAVPAFAMSANLRAIPGHART